MNIARIHRIIDQVRAAGTNLEFYGPQSEETIASVEQALGLHFPEEFRAFLREFGGGGPVDIPLSGIWPGNPFDAGRGSVFGDTVRARIENKLPSHYVVIYRDDDTRSLWIIDTLSVRPDGTAAVLGFPSTRPEEKCFQVAPSYSALVEDHLAGLGD